MRPVKITPNFIKSAAGSVLIEAGNTRVICCASIEDKVPPFLKGSGSGWVTAEYSLLPGSTTPRTQRESARGRISGRTSEIQRLIGRSLRAVVDLEALGERTVWIDCDVIQADGGTRTASVTGGFVALYLAIKHLYDQEVITSMPIKDYVAAISVGIVDGQKMLDLEYVEDSAADVDMNMVLTGAGKIVEIQGTAEQEPFSRQDFDELMGLAEKGINALIHLQKDAIAKEFGTDAN